MSIYIKYREDRIAPPVCVGSVEDLKSPEVDPVKKVAGIRRFSPRAKSKWESISKVLRFLKANPLSTANEIFAATGMGISCAQKFIKMKRYEGRTVWRLNHPKIREYFGDDL